MKTITLTFLGDLNLFLPGGKREVTCTFRGRQTVKHLIESLGVPHTEVGEVNRQGQRVRLDYIPRNKEHLTVHPPAPGCEVEPRFLLDAHLGRLTAYLRMLGFDCLYRNDYDDAELTAIVQREGRILLTRDRRLLMRKAIRYGYCLRSSDPQEQLHEVVRRFDLTGKISPFQRCLRCNHPLQPVPKREILHRLEPLTKKYFNEFHICPHCDQIYWKGSHYERMIRLIESIRG
ncbi:MAG: twitching motility protein PilT [Anaerolineae bacterium]|nr:MAG: twitching motility protein PilT [Anaerolineae bacterium]